MAMSNPSDPLARAREVARDARTQRPDGWDGFAAGIRRRVRALPTGADPVLVRTRADDGSRTLVSTRVLRALLRGPLGAHPTHSPQRIDLVVEDERLVRVEVDLVGAYGADLRAVAGRVHADVRAVLDELLDLAPDPLRVPVDVEVTVVDVVDGDPRLR